MGTNSLEMLYESLRRSPMLRQFVDAFRKSTGLQLALLPAEGKVGKPHERSHTGNEFCRLMSTNPGTCQACLRSHQEMQARLARKLSAHEICCFAGLNELAVPIVLGGCHVATLWGGQVFQRKPQRKQFERLSRRLEDWGLNGKLRQARHAYFNIPVVSEKQFRAAMHMLEIVAGHLAEHASRSLIAARREDPEPVVQAKALIEARSAEPLALEQIAHHVHLSTSHFCKVFKKASGMTFSEYLGRVRVEKAKQFLCNAKLPVTEIAAASGFQSISQFNRVFRRYTSTSPTQYRKSL